MLHAKWIWHPSLPAQGYHQTVIARKTFELSTVQKAELKITADSYYRLFLNGEWINDGPARSWPEHYQYDLLDVTGYLRAGSNEIRVIVRYFGVGSFHTVPRQAGLLAELEVINPEGQSQRLVTNQNWEIAHAGAWISETPKVSIQMEPQEFYDARLESSLNFVPATELYSADAGPWQDLRPRDLAFLTKKPFALRTFLGAKIVQRPRALVFCVPTARLLHPAVIEANHSVSNASGLSTILELTHAASIEFYLEGYQLWIDGQTAPENRFTLTPGRHLALALVTEIFSHQKEKSLVILNPPADLKLINPLAAAHENPWVWIPFPEFALQATDLHWIGHPDNAARNATLSQYRQNCDALVDAVRDLPTFQQHLGARAQCLPVSELFVHDSHRLFLMRTVLADATTCVENPSGLLYDNPEITTIHPAAGDIELCYDLGEQNIGFYDLELISEAGVIIDLYAVEYITPAGELQHTIGNRNGMRYITRAGVNRFTSLKRRAGRYLFITLRKQQAPVYFRKLQLIESTYPVHQIGNFRCSDPQLTQIWEISARTLKLCMEDSFTDCPLYEQTLWVGDARNEAFLNYPVFQATDLAKRGLRLAAQSLERYPLVGCQVPSAWDCLLPAWSFLWGMAVWDYYFYSADQSFLAEMWPWVMRNLEGAAAMISPTGLFSAPLWNMFDWSGIDDQHHTVLHNSLLLVGAIDAALKCAQILQDDTRTSWLQALRSRLTAGISQCWDPARQAYRDSVHADGRLSPSISQHTSFLALLYDLVAPTQIPAALNNLLNPPAEMVRVGSPFAMMFCYEALEKFGYLDEIIHSINECYAPMLAANATTVWETFPSSKYRPGQFPTRSHCHAWSAAPLYFLNRIILGVRPLQPGGAAYEISPHLLDLTWAQGVVATMQGPLTVSWRREADTLELTIHAPARVKIHFKSNPGLAGLKIKHNL